MTRIHDMGGRFGDGPVMPDDAGAAVFPKEWHGRALALTLAAGALGRWNIDASRHMRECLPPADYAGFSYYEKWLAGLANLLVAQGIVSIDEIAAGKALTDGDAALRDRRLTAAAVVPTLQSGGPSARPTDTTPRFAIGDAVMTRAIAGNRNIAGGHTRLPAYAAGRRGVIMLQHGGHVLPDSNAHFDGEAPEHLYTVSFAAGDLWQHAESPDDTVCLDLWDSYLEPA